MRSTIGISSFVVSAAFVLAGCFGGDIDDGSSDLVAEDGFADGDTDQVTLAASTKYNARATGNTWGGDDTIGTRSGDIVLQRQRGWLKFANVSMKTGKSYKLKFRHQTVVLGARNPSDSAPCKLFIGAKHVASPWFHETDGYEDEVIAIASAPWIPSNIPFNPGAENKAAVTLERNTGNGVALFVKSLVVVDD
ncbi:MAG: hypothetical protein MUF54_16550 [Polyangiaceae bacterium]|jgi:predicted small secreted protein|nr:hypothetical protein [Polyangiaceae bacterium]